MPLMDLWQTKDKTSWMEVPHTTRGPQARQRHVALAFKGKLRVMFGLGEGAFLNDIWDFDSDTDTWTELKTTNPPTPRMNPCCSAVGDDIYCFGGTDIDGDDNSVFMLRGSTWTKLEMTGDKPLARRLAVCSVGTWKPEHISTENTRFVLFGGWSGSKSTALGDDGVFYFDMAKPEAWKKFEKTATWPSPRDNTAMCGGGGRTVYLSAGDAKDVGRVNDLWTLDLGSGVWTNPVKNKPANVMARKMKQNSIALRRTDDLPANGRPALRVLGDDQLWSFTFADKGDTIFSSLPSSLAVDTTGQFQCKPGWVRGSPAKCMGDGKVACASDGKDCFWGACNRTDGSMTKGERGGTKPLIKECPAWQTNGGTTGKNEILSICDSLKCPYTWKYGHTGHMITFPAELSQQTAGGKQSSYWLVKGKKGFSLHVTEETGDTGQLSYSSYENENEKATAELVSYGMAGWERKAIVVYGGKGTKEEKSSLSNIMWYFDLAASTWTEMTLTGDTLPAMYRQTMLAVGDRDIYLLGGQQCIVCDSCTAARYRIQVDHAKKTAEVKKFKDGKFVRVDAAASVVTRSRSVTSIYVCGGLISGAGQGHEAQFSGFPMPTKSTCFHYFLPDDEGKGGHERPALSGMMYPFYQGGMTYDDLNKKLHAYGGALVTGGVKRLNLLNYVQTYSFSAAPKPDANPRLVQQ